MRKMREALAASFDQLKRHFVRPLPLLPPSRSPLSPTLSQDPPRAIQPQGLHSALYPRPKSRGSIEASAFFSVFACVSSNAKLDRFNCGDHQKVNQLEPLSRAGVWILYALSRMSFPPLTENLTAGSCRVRRPQRPAGRSGRRRRTSARRTADRESPPSRRTLRR